MNFAQVARILAGFATYFSLSMLVPLVLAWRERGGGDRLDAFGGFLGSMAIGLLVALLLRRAGRSGGQAFYRVEGLATAGFAWLLASALGALPLVWTGALPAVADALFESVSGLTTTGASAFGGSRTPAVEDLPRSILLWRAQLHWLGGIGIVLSFVVLLPSVGAIGKNLLTSEQIGVAPEALRPRMQEQARGLFAVYSALTLLNILLLLACGLSPFDSICHAFATVSTGGFSTRNHSVGAYLSLPVELVTILFMLAGGCNFGLLIAAVRERSASLLWRDAELRLYVWLTVWLVAAVALVLRLQGGVQIDSALGVTRDYGDLGRCLRDAAFQVVSLRTSTGFCIADYQNWPAAALVLLLFAILVGGCTGSTSGGFKVLRLLVVCKLIGYSIRHAIRPRSIEKLHLGQELLPNHVVSAVVALVLMWLSCVGLGTLALALDPGLGVLGALSTSASLQGNAGPAMATVVAATAGQSGVAPGLVNVGPYGSYGDLQDWSKLFASLQMLLGRLEITTIGVLFAPSFWRR
jgi:trk system potassium uptake protein TrkH